MPTDPKKPELMFINGLSENALIEAHDRGYLSHVAVNVGGHMYPVVFYDSIRLQQDVSGGASHGRPFVADPGMIVLSEITLEAIRNVVERLFAEGYFEYLVPLSEERLAEANPYHWPP